MRSMQDDRRPRPDPPVTRRGAAHVVRFPTHDAYGASGVWLEAVVWAKREGTLTKPDDHITVQALWDTGATSTCIDPALAKALGMAPTGVEIETSTAAGETTERLFRPPLMIELFEGEGPAILERVMEARLGWDPSAPHRRGNMGLLVGRDLQSHHDWSFKRGATGAVFTISSRGLSKDHG